MPEPYPGQNGPAHHRYSISLQQAAAAIFGVALVDGEAKDISARPCHADMRRDRRPDEPHINCAAP